MLQSLQLSCLVAASKALWCVLKQVKLVKEFAVDGSEAFPALGRPWAVIRVAVVSSICICAGTSQSGVKGRLFLPFPSPLGHVVLSSQASSTLVMGYGDGVVGRCAANSQWHLRVRQNAVCTTVRFDIATAVENCREFAVAAL